MEIILNLTDSPVLFALLVLLLVGVLTVLSELIIILAREAVSIIADYRKTKRELKKRTHLVFFNISKDENLTRFDIYKRIYNDLKSQLILAGLDEDKASREANKYCVKYTDIIFTEHQMANFKKRDDWQFMNEISFPI